MCPTLRQIAPPARVDGPRHSLAPPLSTQAGSTSVCYWPVPAFSVKSADSCGTDSCEAQQHSRHNRRRLKVDIIYLYIVHRMSAVKHVCITSH